MHYLAGIEQVVDQTSLNDAALGTRCFPFPQHPIVPCVNLMESDRRILTPAQAATVIFRKTQASDREIAFVRRRLESGEIKAIRSHAATDRWVTTTGYLADRALKKSRDRSKSDGSANSRHDIRHTTPAQSTESHGGGSMAGSFSRGTDGNLARSAADKGNSFRRETQLQAVYGEVLRDYFLAIVFRRSARHAGKIFHRSVLVGQVCLLVLIASSVVFAVRHLSAGPTPEQAAIHAWIEQDAGKHTVLQWRDPQPHEEGVAVRVRYRYFTSGRKGIETERRFVLVDGRVTRVDSDW